MCNPLKEKFDDWSEWLLGEDVHSIRNQIHTMIWDSTVFQSINEARRYAPTDDKGRIELNAMVHHFVDRCFFDTQMMAIRRLLDKETRPGERSVTSLWRLLDDMETHGSLLTRQNILDSRGLPYDYEKTKEEVRERYPLTNGPRWLGNDYRQCRLSEDTHKCIDALAGLDASQRSPIDVVRMTVIQWLKARLERCKTIYAYVNKFLAHSATPESRTKLADEEMKITLGQILQAHEIICQVAEFVSQNIFLRSIGNPLPVPQFNQFEHFEKPWVAEETLKKLHEWWRSHAKSTDQWRTWDWQSEYETYRSGGEPEE